MHYWKILGFNTYGAHSFSPITQLGLLLTVSVMQGGLLPLSVIQSWGQENVAWILVLK